MKNRRGLKLGVVAVVLLGTASTAWAQGRWSEASAAKDQFARADAVARATLQSVTRQGLLPPQTARFRARLVALDRQSHLNLMFWSEGSFYRDQAAQAQEISSGLRVELKRVGRQLRRSNARLLSSLRDEIADAQSYGLDTSSASAVLRADTAAGSSAHGLRVYRRIRSSALRATRGLAREIAPIRAYVDDVLRLAAGNTTWIDTRAASEAETAQSQGYLLELLQPSAEGLVSLVPHLLSRVDAAPTIRDAAVNEESLHALASSIAGRYARIVPAKVIVVNTEMQSLTAYANGTAVLTTPVTTGGPELPTDQGVFHIYLKESPFTFHSPWPPGSPFYYDPTPVQYWMPFDGAEGLHDAWWRSNFGPGSNLEPTDLGNGNVILGTHGCVNLPMSAAQFIWDWAPVGTTVVVT